MVYPSLKGDNVAISWTKGQRRGGVFESIQEVIEQVFILLVLGNNKEQLHTKKHFLSLARVLYTVLRSTLPTAEALVRCGLLQAESQELL